MELIDLVNYVIIFLSQMTLLRCLTFLLGSLIVTLTVLPFWIYLYLLTPLFVLQWLFDHVVVSVSTDFTSNSKQDVLFHCAAYDYSYADWDGLHDHEEMSHGKILLSLMLSAASKFCKWVHVGINVYIPHHQRSNLTHPHGFQQLVLLP